MAASAGAAQAARANPEKKCLSDPFPKPERRTGEQSLSVFSRLFSSTQSVDDHARCAVSEETIGEIAHQSALDFMFSFCGKNRRGCLLHTETTAARGEATSRQSNFLRKLFYLFKASSRPAKLISLYPGIQTKFLNL